MTRADPIPEVVDRGRSALRQAGRNRLKGARGGRLSRAQLLGRCQHRLVRVRVLAFARTGARSRRRPAALVPVLSHPARGAAGAAARDRGRPARLSTRRREALRDQGRESRPSPSRRRPPQWRACPRPCRGHAGAAPDDDRSPRWVARRRRRSRTSNGGRHRGRRLERRRGHPARLVAEPPRPPLRHDHAREALGGRHGPRCDGSRARMPVAHDHRDRIPAMPATQGGRAGRSRSSCSPPRGPKKMHRVGSSFVQLPGRPSLALQSLGRPSTSGAPCSVHW